MDVQYFVKANLTFPPFLNQNWNVLHQLLKRSTVILKIAKTYFYEQLQYIFFFNGRLFVELFRGETSFKGFNR